MSKQIPSSRADGSLPADAVANELDATRRSYDRLSRVYDLLADASEREARVAGLAVLAVQPGERVLEIGFGTGHGLVDLARSVDKAGSVVGLDLSPGMRDVAAHRLREEGLADRVRLDLGDAAHLPYGDGEFDVVFMSFTLELFERRDVHAVLSEVSRCLEPGGRLGIVSLVDTDEHRFAVSLYKWFHRHFTHFVDCQPIDVLGRLQRAGFEVVSESRLSLWGLSVAVVVAQTAAGKPVTTARTERR